MFDIDHILNGKSKAKKSESRDLLGSLFNNKPKKDNLSSLMLGPKTRRKPSKGIEFSSYKYKSKDPLLKLFQGQGHPRPNDYKPKGQKRFLKQSRNFKKDRFKDTDGDGVIDGLDCFRMNPEKHMPYLYTWQNPNSDDPEEASDSRYRNQKYGGRSTGMTGTGIYSYKTKEKALKEAEGSDTFKGRKLYSIETKNPKVFTRDEDFRDFNEASKRLNQAKATGNPRAIKEAQMYFKRAGIPVRSDELRDSLQETRDEVEQPVNYLLRRKGYDAVVADDDNDQYRYGSVVIGRKGKFNQRLQDPVDENYDWNENKMKDWSRRIDDNSKRRQIQDALYQVKKGTSNKDFKERMKDQEVESYSDRYDSPIKRNKLNNRARGKLLQEAKESEKDAEVFEDTPELKNISKDRAQRYREQADNQFPVKRLKGDDDD